MASSSESMDSKWVAGNATLSQFASIPSWDHAKLTRNRAKSSILTWLGLGALGTSVLDDLVFPGLDKWAPSLAATEPAALMGIVGLECLGAVASGSFQWFEHRQFKKDLSNLQKGFDSMARALKQRESVAFEQSWSQAWSSCSALASRLEHDDESLTLPGGKPLSAAGFEQWVATRYLSPAIDYAKSLGIASESQATRWNALMRVKELKDHLREDIALNHAKTANPLTALAHAACSDQPSAEQGSFAAAASRAVKVVGALDDVAFPAMAAAGLAIAEPVWMIGGVALLCAASLGAAVKDWDAHRKWIASCHGCAGSLEMAAEAMARKDSAGFHSSMESALVDMRHIANGLKARGQTLVGLGPEPLDGDQFLKWMGKSIMAPELRKAQSMGVLTPWDAKKLHALALGEDEPALPVSEWLSKRKAAAQTPSVPRQPSI